MHKLLNITKSRLGQIIRNLNFVIPGSQEKYNVFEKGEERDRFSRTFVGFNKRDQCAVYLLDVYVNNLVS